MSRPGDTNKTQEIAPCSGECVETCPSSLVASPHWASVDLHASRRELRDLLLSLVGLYVPTFRGCFLAGNTVSVSYTLGVAHHRETMVFFIIIACCNLPSFIVRTSYPGSYSAGSAERPPKLHSEHSEGLEHVSRLLLSPIFVLRLLWIVGLSLLTSLTCY